MMAVTRVSVRVPLTGRPTDMLHKIALTIGAVVATVAVSSLAGCASGLPAHKTGAVGLCVMYGGTWVLHTDGEGTAQHCNYTVHVK